jgi:hypothetical protein
MTTNQALHIKLDTMDDARRAARYARQMADAILVTNGSASDREAYAATLATIAHLADRIAAGVASLGE